MTNPLGRELPAPSDWQAFERLCFDLYKGIWKDNSTELHGRRGQAQVGVDIYGTDYTTGLFTGVQCKGKDGGYGGHVKEEELRREVIKAESFFPKLDLFILVTTAPNDVKIQNIARQISQKNIESGKFRVRVTGWDTLKQFITDDYKLMQKHFFDLAPVDLENKIERLGSDVRNLNNGRLNAEDELRNFVRHVSETHQLMAIHRGVNRWRDHGTILFGNDGYDPRPGEELTPLIIRTRRQVEIIREQLAAHGVRELACAKTDNGATWAILIESNDTGRWGQVLWEAFSNAYEEQLASYKRK